MIKSISKKLYFKKMKETTRQIYPVIIKLIEGEYEDKALREKIMLLVKRRKGKNLARPFIARLGYELCGGTNWKEIMLPIALLELENISTYQINAVYDEKYGVASDNISKINQSIAAALTRDLIQKIIETKISEKFGSEIALEVSKIISEVDSDNYLGQFDEMNKLTPKTREKSLTEYLKVYSKVKRLYGGKWIKCCLLMGALLGKKEKYLSLKDSLAKFGVYCGTAYTMINDISDFCMFNVERGFKVSVHDQFKDIWNGRITLPIYYALSDYSLSTKIEKKFLYDIIAGNVKKNIQNMKRVLRIIVKSGGLDYTYSVMNYLRRKAKAVIKKHPQTPERDYLLLLNSALRTNKFVSELRKKGMKLMDLDSKTTSFLDQTDKAF